MAAGEIYNPRVASPCNDASGLR